MRNSFILWALVACNTTDPVETKAIDMKVTPAPPEKIPVGVPHGGAITHVAVTERADAAVSVDSIGGLRLWPSLDGKQEPVPFSINGAQAVAIAHAGDELLVGVVDQAHAGHVLRFSRAGALRGKVQLPGDTAITQIAGIDGGMVVVRDDQSIERYDARGVQHGRIAADPGMSLGALAVRHGAAAILLATRAPDAVVATLEDIASTGSKVVPPVTLVEKATVLRWITTTDTLAWGTQQVLPNDANPHMLAISPNHKRVALVELDTTRLAMFEIDGIRLTEVPCNGSVVGGDAIAMFDDDHAVAMTGNSLRWVFAKTAKGPTTVAPVDPWAVETTPPPSTVNEGAFASADGLVISAFGPNLVKQNLKDTRYLGWNDVASGLVIVSGASVGVVTANDHIVWLDRNLQREKDVTMTDLGYGTPQRVWWLDPNHALLERPSTKQVGMVSSLELVDFRHHEVSVLLGEFGYIVNVDYQPSLGMIGVLTNSELQRFAVDIEYDKVTKRPTLTGAFTAQVKMLDPAKTGGIVGMVANYENDGQHTLLWREKDGKVTVEHSKEAFYGQIVGQSSSGTMYVKMSGGLRAVKAGKLNQVASEMDSVVPNNAGSRLAGIHGAEVMLTDAEGTAVWRQNVWGAIAVSFTSDEARIIVRTTGGMIVLDATTGERVAAACGFSFGLMTKQPLGTELNTEPVCEDLGT